MAQRWIPLGTVLVGAIGMAVGCADLGLGTGTVCTTEARPALVVTVRDSVTGAPVSDARVIARSGTKEEIAQFPVGGSYSLAHEQAGTYTVTVEHERYRTWTRMNVRVTEDDCHVKTVSLTALLQPPT